MFSLHHLFAWKSPNYVSVGPNILFIIFPACKYDPGEWSSCDADTSVKSRIDTLRTGSHESCAATRTKTKACSIGEETEGDEDDADGDSKRRMC